MLCPECKGKLRVFDVVQNNDETITYRHRVCQLCGSKFYTVENITDIKDVKYKYAKYSRWKKKN